jgi:hypothetical protein
MNQFNDLINLWKSQPAPESTDLQERIDKARREARRLARKVWIRDLQEIGAAVTTTAFFLAIGFMIGGTVLIGASLSSLCLLLATTVLIVSRIQQARENRAPRPTLKAEMEAERRAVERQRWLLGNVTLWYLGPIALAIASFIAGVEAGTPSSDYTFLVVYAIVVIALFVVIRYWNQSTVRRELDPRIRELEELLHDLEKEDS